MSSTLFYNLSHHDIEINGSEQIKDDANVILSRLIEMPAFKLDREGIILDKENKISFSRLAAILRYLEKAGADIRKIILFSSHFGAPISYDLFIRIIERYLKLRKPKAILEIQKLALILNHFLMEVIFLSDFLWPGAATIPRRKG